MAGTAGLGNPPDVLNTKGTRNSKMGDDKYGRSVTLLCPTCGGSQFAYDEGSDEIMGIVKCASCDREMTKDDLIQENREIISENAKEIGHEVVRDLAHERKKSLKKSFQGSKNIKIK